MSVFKKKYTKAAVIIDRQVAALDVTQEILSKIQKFVPAVVIPVVGGESLKTFKNIYPLYAKFIKAGLNRKSVVVAIGGGTVGDAAGFVASTFMRGIDWVNIPTTLLAQVDSAIGGKTGINHELGKNLIGTFHSPAQTIFEPRFLAELTDRDFNAGLFEAVKYGFLFDPKLFQDFQNQLQLLKDRNPARLTSLIDKCVKWKTQIVSEDRLDVKGRRELLNFGHTFGHALENYNNQVQHGEAVGYGMLMALQLSAMKTGFKSGEAVIVNKIGLPKVKWPKDPKHFWERMLRDKKNTQAGVKMVLLKEIGQPVAGVSVTENEFRKAYAMTFFPTQGSRKQEYIEGRAKQL